MGDRQLPSSRAIQSGISKTRGGGGGGAGAATERVSTREREMSTQSAASSVRRNLFQSQLTRRPTAGSSTSDETVRLDSYPHQHQHQQQHHPQQQLTLDITSPSADDIVVRDQNGEIELGDPPTPPIDDPDELEAIEEQLELERERQRLADAIKQRQADQNRVTVQFEELPEQVKTSLRAKVAALAEDNWMYEREELPRRQL
ncbi:hypothetical protein QBC44DRAFT_321207 [Cladorrhinum sp. PSN332]|nr:hypothetical protein QBC44DRAFT_321207 [Cladorrhinum sp. PSN332]